jgi:hypothetical protein
MLQALIFGLPDTHWKSSRGHRSGYALAGLRPANAASRRATFSRNSSTFPLLCAVSGLPQQSQPQVL